MTHNDTQRSSVIGLNTSFLRRMAEQRVAGNVPPPHIRSTASAYPGQITSGDAHVKGSDSNNTADPHTIQSETAQVIRSDAADKPKAAPQRTAIVAEESWITSDLTGMEQLFQQATIVVTPQWSSATVARPLPLATGSTTGVGSSEVLIDAARQQARPESQAIPGSNEVVHRKLSAGNFAAAPHLARARAEPATVTVTEAHRNADHPADIIVRRVDPPMGSQPAPPSFGVATPSARIAVVEHHGADKAATRSMGTPGAQREAARQPAAAPNAASIGETQPDAATAYVGAESVHTAGKELDAAADVPAAWEVDRFAWPADCQKLVRCLGQELLEAGRELVAAAQRGVRCIAITGAHRGEGRTTVCMLLAYAAARAGARVALIEADLDNPRISALLELQPPFDWRSAYRYSQPFDEAAVYSVEDKIVILPLLGQSGDSPQQPAPDTWQQLLSQWGAKYFDLILVDLGVWDTAITRYLPSECGRLFQAVLVVCDVRSTAAGSLEALVRDILNQGIESVGMIENFVGPETA